MNLSDQLARHPYDPSWSPIERMADVLAIVETWPGMHDQEVYEFGTDCGTPKCIAGWHHMRAGVEIRLLRMRSTSHKVAASLGLPFSCEDHVFDGDNTLDDIYRLAALAYAIPETDLRDRVAEVRAERGWL